jgi:AcrR family transcriptional regulator
MLARAALRLLAKEEWAKLTLAAIARAAKLPLRDVLVLMGSKTAVAGLVLRMLARETASRYSADSASDDLRERLFDVTMMFFDVQAAHAAALKKFYRALQVDPVTLLAVRGDILGIAGELLALAEADFGLSPRLQAGVFAGVLIRAVSAWRHDEAEMGKTMAQLDGDLRRVERLLWRKHGTAAPDLSRGSPVPAGETKERWGRPRSQKKSAAAKPAGGWRRAGRRGGSRPR